MALLWMHQALDEPVYMYKPCSQAYISLAWKILLYHSCHDDVMSLQTSQLAGAREEKAWEQIYRYVCTSTYSVRKEPCAIDCAMIVLMHFQAFPLIVFEGVQGLKCIRMRGDRPG